VGQDRQRNPDTTDPVARVVASPGDDEVTATPTATAASAMKEVSIHARRGGQGVSDLMPKP
jgi:hypothetical protein